jgi:hypothetical protein
VIHPGQGVFIAGCHFGAEPGKVELYLTVSQQTIALSTLLDLDGRRRIELDLDGRRVESLCEPGKEISFRAYPSTNPNFTAQVDVTWWVDWTCRGYRYFGDLFIQGPAGVPYW